MAKGEKTAVNIRMTATAAAAVVCPRKSFRLTLPKGLQTATAIIAPQTIEMKKGAMTAPAASTTPMTKTAAIAGPAMSLSLSSDIRDSMENHTAGMISERIQQAAAQDPLQSL